jgi:hypothetical protein
VRLVHCSRIARQDCNKDLRPFGCGICLVIQPLIEGFDA